MVLSDFPNERVERRRKFVRILKFAIIVLVVIIELVGELLGPEAPVEGRYFLIGPVLS